MNSCLAQNPQEGEWDVAVIGTGMGGATVGYRLAELGRRVLFIEKGRFLQAELPAATHATKASQLAINAEEQPEARLKAGWWPQRIQGTTTFGQVDFFAPVGCGTGGTTALYGAGLERLFPADFRPKGNFPQVSDSTLPESWPISYDELKPYYEQAETLFKVRGTSDPLRGESSSVDEPPPLSPRDQQLFDSFRQLGLNPYRHHVGFAFVKDCHECLGKICPRQCKSDSGQICLLPALQRHDAKLLPNCEVLKLEADDSTVKSIECRLDNKTVVIKAKIIIMAAGAFRTPVILLNSKSSQWPQGLANRSGMVGRNLMLHASDFYAMKPASRLSPVGPKKTLAMNDFYHPDGEKLGTFQIVGAAVSLGQIMQYMRDVAERDPTWWKKLASPRPLWWRKLSSPIIRLIAATAYYVLNFRHAVMWSSTIEDLPYYDNRIVIDPATTNGMRFEYRYTDELKARVQSFRRRLHSALGPHRVINLAGDNNINYGHVCGTCRFGDDPATSVLNKNNRAHDLNNLYVVDASFFPSSGGVNPTLTIAANALRIAEVIDQQLGR